MKLRYIIMGKISKVIQLYRYKRVRLFGYHNIHASVILESKLNLDKVHPKGLHIGANTLIASRSTILCHEHVKRDKDDVLNPWVTDTYIGKNCFVGVGSMILPGVKIGDEVIIGAATVVTKDIPSNSIAVGNPARVVRTNIKLDDKAILIEK